MNKILLKAVPLVVALLLFALLTAPVLAPQVPDGNGGQGAHLWFYSVDPVTIGYPPLPNPETADPNYVSADPDPWLTESVVVPSGDWETPFNIWLGNHAPRDTSYDTIVLISYNVAAAAAIDDMSVASTSFDLTPSDPADFPLPPHGISNSAEWYGFQVALVGNIPSGGYIGIPIDIDLNPGADLSEAKIHFDAIGWSTEEHPADLDTYNIFSPFSHDSTFVIPEPATIALAASSLVALGTYAYKRRKK